MTVKGIPAKQAATRVLAALAFVLLTAASGAADPDKVVGPTRCADHCHVPALEAWKQTRHFTSFRTLIRSEETQDIKRKLGLERIKSNSPCTECHYTVQTVRDKHTAIAGVSCESCHGPARDWEGAHFEGFRQQESAEAERLASLARWAKAEALGMIGSRSLYKMAKSCFGCHQVANERLVNVGGHRTGTRLELVSWSQGEVRHNYWYSKDKKNREATIERKRMMFLVGLVVELETGLAALGKATVKDTYAKAMAKRVSDARRRLAACIKLLPDVPELADIHEAAKSVALKLRNEANLIAAAGEISVLALAFSTRYDGSAFGAMDEYIPEPDKYLGAVQP